MKILLGPNDNKIKRQAVLKKDDLIELSKYNLEEIPFIVKKAIVYEFLNKAYDKGMIMTRMDPANFIEE